MKSALVAVMFVARTAAAFNGRLFPPDPAGRSSSIVKRAHLSGHSPGMCARRECVVSSLHFQFPTAKNSLVTTKRVRMRLMTILWFCDAN